MERRHLGLNGALTLGLFAYECHYAIHGAGAGYAEHSDVYAQSRTASGLARQRAFLDGIEGKKMAADRALAPAPGQLPAKKRQLVNMTALAVADANHRRV